MRIHAAALLVVALGASGAPAAETGAVRRPEFFPPPGATAGAPPFSEAVRVGDMLHLAGQIGVRPGTRELVPGGIVPETRRTLENIRAILERRGSSLDRVVKCTVFLADIGEWPAMNDVYRTFFPRDPPARSALGANGLALGARVEIECLAVVGAAEPAPAADPAGAPPPAAAGPAAGADRPDLPDRRADEAALRALHEAVLAAHRAGDVERWMAVEADEGYVVAHDGRVATPTAAERRAARDGYLAATRFAVYRDRREPIVEVSADGTRGWVLAEVEIRGSRVEDGAASPVEADFAWVELYAKRDGRWRMVGNVSNRKP